MSNTENILKFAEYVWRTSFTFHANFILVLCVVLRLHHCSYESGKGKGAIKLNCAGYTIVTFKDIMSIKEKPPIDPEKTNMWIFFFQLREMIVSEWNRTKKMTAVSLIELSSRAVVWWFDLAEVKLTLAAQGACAAPSLLLLLQLLFLIQCDWKYQGTWFLRNYLIFCRPSAHCSGCLRWQTGHFNSTTDIFPEWSPFLASMWHCFLSFSMCCLRLAKTCVFIINERNLTGD